MPAPGGNLGGNNGANKVPNLTYDIPTAANGISVQGTVYYSGSGVPPNSIGNNGDQYWNTAGGAGTTLYQKRAGVWVGLV